MIGKLKGKVEEIGDDYVIIDVGGVGYQVYATSRTLASLSVGQAAQLIIETHVREDHIHLYGFSDTAERDWFRLLGTVQRVGNKMALTILGAYPTSQIAHAILAKDTTVFSRISGVGAKLAERIVTELKDKVTKLSVSSNEPIPISSGKKSKKDSVASGGNLTDDAISALVNLGYSRSEAYAAALKASQSPDGKSIDQLIRLSLKELARG